MIEREAVAQQVRQRHQDELLRVPGVVGTGIAETMDQTGGRTLCIRIYVERITDKLQARLPKTLDGIPTTVVEVGRPRLL